MTLLLVVVTGVLCVLTILVVGLVHGYAGLLERVRDADGAGSSPVAPQQFALSTRDDTPHRSSHDVVGTTVDGDVAVVRVARPGRDTLLAFLSSTCTSCRELLAGLETVAASLPAHVGLVVIAKGSEAESPSALSEVATGDVPLILSSEAWRDYEVPGSPYFVFIDGDRAEVVGEGTAQSWRQVRDLMAMAMGDATIASGTARLASKPARDLDREAEVDRALMDAGILPGDPSLYAGGTAPERPE